MITKRPVGRPPYHWTEQDQCNRKDMQRLRSRYGMTQIQFAKEINIKPGRLNQYEQGKVHWPQRLVDLANARLNS